MLHMKILAVISGYSTQHCTQNPSLFWRQLAASSLSQTFVRETCVQGAGEYSIETRGKLLQMMLPAAIWKMSIFCNSE